MTLQSQKIALNSNKSQQKAFDEHCAYAVLAYNAAHSDFKTGLDAGEWRSVYALKRIFNARKGAVFPEYKTCSQHAAKNAIHNFGDAVNRWQTRQNRFPLGFANQTEIQSRPKRCADCSSGQVLSEFQAMQFLRTQG